MRGGRTSLARRNFQLKTITAFFLFASNFLFLERPSAGCVCITQHIQRWTISPSPTADCRFDSPLAFASLQADTMPNARPIKYYFSLCHLLNHACMLQSDVEIVKVNSTRHYDAVCKGELVSALSSERFQLHRFNERLFARKFHTIFSTIWLKMLTGTG